MFKVKFYALWCFVKAVLTGRFETNGSRIFLTLGEVLEKYKTLHLPTVTESTRYKLLNRTKKFLTPHLHEPMAYLNPEKVAEFIAHAKSTYVQGPYSKRYNFHKEVKDLKALCSWW